MKLFFILYGASVLFTLNLVFQDTALEESMARGKDVYADFCVSCHLDTGEGILGSFPPLANSDYLRENRKASIAGVKYGQKGELVVNGVTYNNTMAPMGLSDAEIADVMNYIMHSWGNTADKMVTEKEVNTILKE